MSSIKNPYSQAQIYKLVNGRTGDLYVGATTLSLGRRFSKHKYDAKKFPNRCVYKKLNEIGWDYVNIILIEKCETCTSKVQMAEREAYWCEQLGATLNNNVPNRSTADSKKAYRDAHKAEAKAYRVAHKDKMKAYQKKYRESHEAEGQEYRDSHKEQKNAYNKSHKRKAIKKVKKVVKKAVKEVIEKAVKKSIKKAIKKVLKPSKRERRKQHIRDYYHKKNSEYMFED